MMSPRAFPAAMTGSTENPTGPGKISAGSAKLQFSLTGFSHEMGFRVFTFDGIATDRTRIVFTVKVDLSLIPKYGVQLQELPLLCTNVLQQRNEGDENRSFTYTEDDMRLQASDRAAARQAAASKRRAPARPASAPAGPAWRFAPRPPEFGPADPH